MPRILLIYFEKIDIIKEIKTEVGKILNFDIEIYPAKPKISTRERPTPFGTQLNAEDFIPIIVKIVKKENADYGLGISSKDLFVPGLNFVFGLASQFQRACAISLARLIDKDKNLYVERAVKEAVHELYHTMGLKHCVNSRCVMCFSNSIYEVDKKGKELCSRCKKLINQSMLNNTF